MPLDQFETMDVPFDRTGAVGQRQPGKNGGFVLFDTACKGHEDGDGGGSHLAQPDIKPFACAFGEDTSRTGRLITAELTDVLVQDHLVLVQGQIPDGALITGL